MTDENDAGRRLVCIYLYSLNTFMISTHTYANYESTRTLQSNPHIDLQCIFTNYSVEVDCSKLKVCYKSYTRSS